MSSVPVNRQVLLPATPSELTEQTASERRSYGQILRSSVLIGGSQALTILVGIVRTKAMAVLLGPSGVGLAGLYGSIADLAVSTAGMGVNSSGVRQIAEAVGSGDTERIARTAVVLRRTSIFLGLLGAVMLIAFPAQVSMLTFGNTQRTTGVSLLSVAVFLRLVSAGQGALIQGMRRISDLAKMSILGAVFGTVTSIPLVYFFREDGVVPSLVGAAAMTIITSYWYSRKINIPVVSMTKSQVRQEASILLKLGFAFMASGLMMMGSAYAIRIIILHKLGVEATGLYQSAWTLGGLYVGFILQAMGADFYPRLTAVINDHVRCNRMVNEQAQIGLLLAGPGITATLTCAPLVLSMFYAAQFSAAVELLRWICVGIAMRVISWPMGIIIMAKGRQGMIIACEVAWAMLYLSLAWICISQFGLDGAGIAFCGAYIFHIFLNYTIVRRLSGFRLSVANRKIAFIYWLLVTAVFFGFHALPSSGGFLLGAIATVISCVYSSHVLTSLVAYEQIPIPLRRILRTSPLHAKERR